MAKRNKNLKAAKAAKQKKIAIGGGLVLVALLAFMGPRTLKMLHHHGPKSSAAARTHTATTPSTAVPSIPVANTATGAPVLTAQLAPAAREGQLSALSASFKTKDPFRQLINDDVATSSPTPGTVKPEKPSPTPNLKVVPSSPLAATAGNSAPAVRKAVLPFLSAVISLNGVREGVNVKLNFPAGSPLFHLVSLTKNTAKISIAGGSLASGKPTLTIRRGRPVTLVNTADGTRYRLVLLKTSKEAVTTPQPAAPGSGAATPTPTPTTETTTTETTTTPTIGG